MKTIEYEGWAYADPAKSHDRGDTNVHDGVSYQVYGFKTDASVGRAKVVIEIADDFDPREQFVKDLQEAKRKLMADFQARVTEIDRQISEFTALEMA